MLQCDGKCHLATQLAQVENDTEDAPFSQGSTSYNLEINLDLAQSQVDIQPNLDVIEKAIYFSENSILCDGFNSITSPPPKV